MKVLFAVSNEGISEAIVKKYQQIYKEIISSKNVYYFNAIIKELQKDKSYDRIIISEDLEPFANNNYDTIDNFLFEKLDSISDEASNTQGEDIPIILISADRRTKGENILVKLFGIGIYNALIGDDRSIEQVCSLINKPRSKKDAKMYYKIASNEVGYNPENEGDVSETEIQNILLHYKKLGKNEDKYVSSFDSIATQYNDEQLKLIIKFLPLNVKAVLESDCPKYQQLVAFSGQKGPRGPRTQGGKKADANKTIADTPSSGIKIASIGSNNGNTRLTKPVVIPTEVNKQTVKKVPTATTTNSTTTTTKSSVTQRPPVIPQPITNTKANESGKELEEIENILKSAGTPKNIQNTVSTQNTQNIKDIQQSVQQQAVQPQLKQTVVETPVAPPRRGRGRPPKAKIQTEQQIQAVQDLSQETAQSTTIKQQNMQQQEAIENTQQIEQVAPQATPQQIEQITSQAMPQQIRQQVPQPTAQVVPETPVTPVRRGRGRPPKRTITDQNITASNVLPGFEETNMQSAGVLPGFEDENPQSTGVLPGFEDENPQSAGVLPGFEDENPQSTGVLPGFEDENPQSAGVLPGFEDENPQNTGVLPGFEDDNSQNTGMLHDSENQNEQNTQALPGFEDMNSQSDSILPGMDDLEDEFKMPGAENFQNNTNQYQTNPTDETRIEQYNVAPVSGELNNILQSREKKIVGFVGTSKNGTSFLVNSLAQMFSEQGIKTAILDLTDNKNAYYIYTKNEEQLRNIAFDCIDKLSQGMAEGIKVNQNLDVYTSLPGDKNDDVNPEMVLSTLARNYSLVLIDCDFKTNYNFIALMQELYLVQSMDVLTIQPLTAYLRDLKAKNVLDSNKLRIVINKYTKVRSITEKTIIGGMAYYNDPSMSFMTELFNKETIKYVVIPFDQQTYSKYLEGLVNCVITVNGYSKDMVANLKRLTNLVYPLIADVQKYGKKNKKEKPVVNNKNYTPNSGSNFTRDMNETLNKMKNNY